MFYYPNVLHRHSGCFSTIWLAATTRNRVSRRECLGVNVKLTCSDILDYVLGQVPPPQPHQPRPRFSLYLSSQLQYGVVIVYHKQCSFLLEEVQQCIGRWLRSKQRAQIDLAESDRMALDVPDDLNLMENAEGAQDPFFGRMASHQLPSPDKLVVAEFEYESLQHSLVCSPNIKLNHEDLSLPAAAITLTEKEQFVINAAEDFAGPDLPEVTAREIQLLMDQPDHFRREEEEEEGANERTRDQVASSCDLQLKETMLGTEQDSMWMLDQEAGGSVEVPLATIGDERTPECVAMPSESLEESLCEEVADRPPRKQSGRRRRQLVFVDPEVQISDKEMQKQIENPLIETKNMMETLILLPALTQMASSAQLFSAPCGSLLHPSLLSLWKQQASITPLNESNEMKGAEGVSEQDMETLRIERKRRLSRIEEMSSESGLQTTEGSSALDLMLEVSKEGKAGSDGLTPVSRWSPHEDVQPAMEPIMEENLEMPQSDTEGLLSSIASVQLKYGMVTFLYLLPPEADRFTAACTFSKLLDLVSDKQVTVGQPEPYGNISIKPAATRAAHSFCP
ncbi:REC8 meiotic recombination protein b [Cyprinodon tularosa]|uniref:REC8 meiotic recombination protein b n=1 Tax=Cyprinodon tularosa TaxID=77115 RepID=UPI0018E25314|nr:REC8 meiotic recombination protein b [Cyprinodon tularosa]